MSVNVFKMVTPFFSTLNNKKKHFFRNYFSSSISIIVVTLTFFHFYQWNVFGQKQCYFLIVFCIFYNSQYFGFTICWKLFIYISTNIWEFLKKSPNFQRYVCKVRKKRVYNDYLRDPEFVAVVEGGRCSKVSFCYKA